MLLPPTLPSNQSVQDKKLHYGTKDKDPPKPTEAMPPYIINFPTFKPPPQVYIDGPPKLLRTNRTPKGGGGDTPAQASTQGKTKPRVTWNGGVGVVMETDSESDKRDK